MSGAPPWPSPASRIASLKLRVDVASASVVTSPAQPSRNSALRTARVNRLSSADLRGRDDGRYRQVTLAWAGGPDTDGLVRELYVQRLRVGGRVHGDGREAELTGGTNHPERDLSAVRHEDLLEALLGHA